ncbi:MAG: superoxide dismutase [Lachnospiraceae bacterium]|nr:superoxide dismutase [Lachnospiraceae bacterium]
MFQQIELPYGFDALEPYIDTATMETHYGKHHAAYTKNLNDAVAKAGLEDMEIEKLLGGLDQVEEGYRTAIRNNGGGFYNHNLYFEALSPNAAHAPEGKLLEKINAIYGSLEALKAELTELSLGQFGSGWAWLSADWAGNLFVSKSANQDNPISLGEERIPLLAIDVWEHAYYLKYRNLRADYVKALWNVIDWKKVEERFDAVLNP